MWSFDFHDYKGAVRGCVTAVQFILSISSATYAFLFAMEITAELNVSGEITRK